MAVAMRPRDRVVNGLHEPIGDLVRAIDAVQVVVRVHIDQPGACLPNDVRRLADQLFAARDSYLAPLVRRAEEGR